MYFFLTLLVALAAAVDGDQSFKHPGLLHSASDFERVRSNVDCESEPWWTAWNKLTSNSHAQSSWTPDPKAIVYRGTGYPENYASLYKDAAAAYALALRWKISGDAEYAEASTKILDAWGSSLRSIEGSSDRYLASGLYGYQLANAVEIMRGYAGWNSTALKAVVNMLRDIIFPMNHDFLIGHNGNPPGHYWANWDLCNIAAMQAIGILSDNRTMYNEAMTYFKFGTGNGAIQNALWTNFSETGTVGGKQLSQNQEAGRDQGHATLDFALFGVIAQQAWNQGDDLFGYLDSRILAGSEHVAKYNLGFNVPFSPYFGILATNTNISSDSRGNVRPIWELFVGHYEGVRDLNASWTSQMRDHVVSLNGGAEGGGGNYGPNSGGYDQLGWGTLMYRVDP